YETAGRVHVRWLETLAHRLWCDHALGDVLARGQLEHHIEECSLDDRAEAAGPGLALERLVRDLPERIVGEDELDVVVGEKALVLLRERVLRLDEDLDQVLAAELMDRRDHR